VRSDPGDVFFEGCPCWLSKLGCVPYSCRDIMASDTFYPNEPRENLSKLLIDWGLAYRFDGGMRRDITASDVFKHVMCR